MPTKRTVTIELSPQQESLLNDLTDRVPLASKHGVAKAALLLGLQELSHRPTASVVDELVAIRRESRGEEAPRKPGKARR